LSCSQRSPEVYLGLCPRAVHVGSLTSLWSKTGFSGGSKMCTYLRVQCEQARQCRHGQHQCCQAALSRQRCLPHSVGSRRKCRLLLRISWQLDNPCLCSYAHSSCSMSAARHNTSFQCPRHICFARRGRGAEVCWRTAAGVRVHSGCAGCAAN